MTMKRSPELSTETTEEPTPKPASSVSSVAYAEQSPWRRAERKAALLEYFANPTPEMRDVDAAWEEALARYGDEDSDAWVAALEDGSHPLCRVSMTARSA
jgi:hypothetical protein